MSLLDKYNNIGIDLDGTLIEGKASKKIAEYITRNKGKKKFSIITFRNNESDAMIMHEIQAFHRNLHLDNFQYIISCPRTLRTRYDIATAMIRAGHPSEEFYEDIALMTEWKAKICRKIGATVLIDDLPDMVVPGCERYNIQYVNPKDLI